EGVARDLAGRDDGLALRDAVRAGEHARLILLGLRTERADPRGRLGPRVPPTVAPEAGRRMTLAVPEHDPLAPADVRRRQARAIRRHGGGPGGRLTCLAAAALARSLHRDAARGRRLDREGQMAAGAAAADPGRPGG